MTTSTQRATPVIRWAGGKGAIASEIIKRISPDALLGPSGNATYFEPFLGGGAVFFALQPARAILSDINAELVNAYNVIATAVDSLLERLDAHASAHVTSPERYYYMIRQRYNDLRSMQSPIDRAAAFLYLNRACYNGLYRVNRRGGFNVPIGRNSAGLSTVAFDGDNLRRVALAFAGASVIPDPYDTVVARAVAGDVVYFDPPYDGTFSSYDADGFGEDEQRELGDIARRLAKRGVHVIASNADTPLVREVWDGWSVERVNAPRAIGGRGASRVSVAELVISIPAGGVE